MRWFLNGLAVTIIFILIAELIVPLLADITAEGVWPVAIGSVLTILTSAPFIWAMWFLFRGFQTEHERADPTEYAAGATLLAIRFLTIIWLDALSAQFSPSQCPEGSLMVNRTIRELGIRERFHAMVVGLERGGQRILNPEYDMSLQVGDLLWLVGQRADLNRLNRELSRF